MFTKNGDNSFNVTKIVTEKQGKVLMTCPLCMATYEEGEQHNCQPPVSKEDKK